MITILWAVFVWLAGAGVGAMCAWYLMDGRVEFWKGRWNHENRVKNALLKENRELWGRSV